MTKHYWKMALGRRSLAHCITISIQQSIDADRSTFAAHGLAAKQGQGASAIGTISVCY